MTYYLCLTLRFSGVSTECGDFHGAIHDATVAQPRVGEWDLHSGRPVGPGRTVIAIAKHGGSLNQQRVFDR